MTASLEALITLPLFVPLNSLGPYLNDQIRLLTSTTCQGTHPPQRPRNPRASTQTLIHNM